MLEVNLGTVEDNRPIFVSASLDEKFRNQLIDLVKEYKDCFAWSYDEMPSLDSGT